MDLIEFRRSLRRHLRASLVAALIVLALALVAARGTQVTYAATSSVLLTPRAERFQDSSASVLRVILPNVQVVANSDTLHTAAAAQVPAAYVDTPIAVTATLDSVASTLLVTVKSRDPAAAVAWSAALAHALADRMKNDAYLGVQVLDVAQGASLTGRRVEFIGVATSLVLALFAFVLVAFAAERLAEARDVAGALRRKGVRVLGSVGTKRRYRRKADGLPVVLAALVEDEHEARRLVVTALRDAYLARWLAEQLDPGEAAGNVADPPFGPAVEFLDSSSVHHLQIFAGPAVDQLCLRAALVDCDACIVAVDDRASSVADIVAGVHQLRAAGLECRGVVLIRGASHIHSPHTITDPDVPPAQRPWSSWETAS